MMDDGRLAHMRAHLECFACPGCAGVLDVEDGPRCAGCGAEFEVESGVPHLFVPNDWQGGKRDVTDRVRAFYEENPFPNYDGFETVGDLVSRAEKGIFARMLNEQIPYRSKVLEVGCGTGQLTNYLGIAQRSVFGADMTLNSLAMAEAFRAANCLDRVGFYQMNLFRPVFRPATFDVVICNGVLHHTSAPRDGFRAIAELVKPGGAMAIGLYNTYGRIFTDLRRHLFRLGGKRLRELDPHLRGGANAKRKKDVWYADQYENPHESKHSMGELLEWLDEAGFDFTYGLPAPKPFQSFSKEDRLFEPHDPGSALERLLAQLRFLVRGSKEGGLFMMIGKKRPATAPRAGE